VERLLQHFGPSGRIAKSDTDGVPDEGRDARRVSGGDEAANVGKPIIGESDGELGGRHTDYHTTGGGSP
jgi:hypothetical protein